MPTVSLNQSIYQGRVTGAAVAWVAGKNAVTGKGTLSDADLADAAKTCGFGVEVSFDGGLTWSLGQGYTWAGGLTDPRSGGPAIPAVMPSYGGSSVKPTHARVYVDAPTPMSVGATLDFS